MCNFMRFSGIFLVHLTATWIWEGDSYISLLASRSDVPRLIFWSVGHPNLNSWGVRTPTRATTTPTVAAPLYRVNFHPAASRIKRASMPVKATSLLRSPSDEFYYFQFIRRGKQTLVTQWAWLCGHVIDNSSILKSPRASIASISRWMNSRRY